MDFVPLQASDGTLLVDPYAVTAVWSDNEKPGWTWVEVGSSIRMIVKGDCSVVSDAIRAGRVTSLVPVNSDDGSLWVNPHHVVSIRTDDDGDVYLQLAFAKGEYQLNVPAHEVDAFREKLRGAA
jgi:hypothetical protein